MQNSVQNQSTQRPPLACGRYLLAVLVALILPGCDRGADEVRTYVIPKEAPAPVAAASESTAAPSAAPGTIAWVLPAGWRAAPNTSSMRFATLTAGEGDDAIDVSVTQLVGEAGGVGPNVNRWRRQLGLPPASDSELKSIAKPIRAQGTNGIIVDLVGTAASGDAPPPRMLAAIFRTPTHTWFVKVTGPSDVLEQHRAAFVQLCESVRFDAAPAPQARRTPAPPTMPDATQVPSWGALPAGWSADASPAAMSVASFHVSDAAQQAVMTITPLGGTQDLLGNVNRWRRQVGLGPLTALAADAARPIEVAGDAGTLVDVAGPDRHTIGAIVVRQGRTWFYKLSGPDPLVASQGQAFESFLGSIHFDGDHHE